MAANSNDLLHEAVADLFHDYVERFVHQWIDQRSVKTCILREEGRRVRPLIQRNCRSIRERRKIIEPRYLRIGLVETTRPGLRMSEGATHQFHGSTDSNRECIRKIEQAYLVGKLERDEPWLMSWARRV